MRVLDCGIMYNKNIRMRTAVVFAAVFIMPTGILVPFPPSCDLIYL